MIRILSLGAGVQSSALMLLSIRGELPRIDHAIFADTHWEPPSVYRQLEFLRGEAAKASIGFHVVSAGNLREHVLDAAEGRRKRCSKPPMYTRGPRGSASMLKRDCTRDFKVRPIERKARELAGLKRGSRPKEPVVEQWFGISIDETQRYRISKLRWVTYRHPLIDDLSMSRHDCQAWMRARGYPEAPKSACIGCPFHDAAAWREVRADPVQWADACDFDRRARTIPGVRSKAGAFLHRSLRPLSEAPFDAPGQTDVDWGMQQECSGSCGV